MIGEDKRGENKDDEANKDHCKQGGSSKQRGD